MRNIFLFIFISCFLGGFAQNKTADSLKSLLDNYKLEDSAKIDLLYDYAYYIRDNDLHAAIKYNLEGIQLSKKLNKPEMLLDGFLELSYCYTTNNNYDSAISVLFEGLDQAEKFHIINRDPVFFGVLGESYRLLQNYSKAEYYHKKAVQSAREQKNNSAVLYTLSSLARLYVDEKQWNKMDSVASEVMALANAQNNTYYIREIMSYKGEEAISLKDFHRALKIEHDLLDTKNLHGLAYVFTLMSTIFLQMNNADSAGWYAKAALDTAKKYDLKKEAGDAYQALYDYNYYYKNYKNALTYLLVLDSINAKAMGTKAGQSSLQAEMKYDQGKKDLFTLVEQQKKDAEVQRIKNEQYYVIGILAVIAMAVILIAILQFRNNKQKQKANRLLETQKIKIENTLTVLKSTQSQLIQSEKMASLGELTAGIAHEIQNPLNFVNNFSEVNKELVEELRAAKDDPLVHDKILDDIDQNLDKVIQHGRRADAIVKGMLQHSRSSAGQNEPTDINALADEYLRLACHGLRAKDKEFNVVMKTDFDSSVGTINIIPQDIGRVFLNLFNNALYAVNEKSKQNLVGYEPIVSVGTKRRAEKVEISVKDNGNGIPPKIIDKIFQPFFTTKPTGQGTGLGLSLSYDIVKAHGGELKAETEEGEYAEFVVLLPAKENF